MIVSAIVATGKNRVIGKDNELLWRLPLEMKFFKETTMGHHLIMGRKTFESFPNPLPGRTSIVITRNPNYDKPGCLVVHSLDEALGLAKARGEKETFVTGGEEIYKLALPFIEKLYLTEVDFEGKGDAYFPAMDLSSWKMQTVRQEPVSEKNPLAWTTKIYTKKYTA